MVRMTFGPNVNTPNDLRPLRSESNQEHLGRWSENGSFLAKGTLRQKRAL